MNRKLHIIGIAGTNGAGKDTVGNLLEEHHNYLFVSVTDLLRHEARRRDLPVERGVLRNISAEWRRELGLGVLVEKSVAEYEKHRDKYSGVVLSSLRNPGEADTVHEYGGTVIWIDAKPEVRYARIQKNAASRGRAGEDDKTFKQFVAEESAEMHKSGDDATLDMSSVKEKSDIFMDNSHENLEVFRKHVEKELNF